MNLSEAIIMAGQLAGALTAIGGIVYLIVKYVVVRPIQKYIDSATYQIQPHANGGRSLADVAVMVGQLKLETAIISARLEVLEGSSPIKRKRALKQP
jgi:hypothetical protein